MNCFCKQPKPAVVKKVSKSGDNCGREFFTCSINDESTRCNFFHWVGAPMPTNMANAARRKPVVHQAVARKPGQCEAKFQLWKFDEGPPGRVWFNITCVMSPALLKFILSIAEDMRQYQEGLKMWTFDFLVYEDMVCKLQSDEFSSEVAVVELPKFLATGLKKYLVAMAKLGNGGGAQQVLNLHPFLRDTLLPFQMEGIRFVVRHGGRALIADEMGCGKTLQAVGVIQHYRRQWPVLVMMPPILVKQWTDELLMYSEGLLEPRDICVLLKGSDVVRAQSKVVLVPYTLVDKLVDKERLSPQQFGVVIADESHNLKSGDAKRTSSALPFLKGAVVAVCLTGTPMLNRPMELFTQLSGLLPSVFCDHDAFGRRYCDPKVSRFAANVTEYKGSTNESELKMLLEGLVMIRRLKSEVILDMPTKTRELRYVPAEGKHLGEIGKIQKRTAAIEQELKGALSDEDSYALKNEQRQLLTRYYQVTGLVKLKAIKEELFRLVDEARLQRATDESQVLALTAAETTTTAAIAPAATNVMAAMDLTNDNEINRADGIGFVSAAQQQDLCEARRSVLDDDTVELEAPRSRSSSIESNKDGEAEAEFDCDNGGKVPKARQSSKKLLTSAPVLMEIEDDLMLVNDVPDDADDDNNQNGNKKSAAWNDSGAEDELNDSSDDEGGENKKGRKANGRKRLQRKTCTATSAVRDNKAVKKRSEVEEWAPLSDDDDNEDEGDLDKRCAADGGRGGDTDDSEYEVVSKRGASAAAGKRKRATRQSSAVIMRSPVAASSSSAVSVVGDKNAYSEMVAAAATMSASKRKPRKGSKAAIAAAAAIAASEEVTRGDDTANRNSSSGDNTTTAKKATGLGKKILVFCHHAAVMDAIAESLDQLAVQHVRIDGGVTGPNRNKLIAKFQQDDATDVALLSVTACGTGLNLTRANVALFAELYWSPGVVLQAEDRIHRLGQKAASVRIIYLVAKNTADDIVWEQIQKKHSAMNNTVGVGDRKGAGMAGGANKGMTINKRPGQHHSQDSAISGGSGSSSSSVARPAAGGQGQQGTLDMFVSTAANSARHTSTLQQQQYGGAATGNCSILKADAAPVAAAVQQNPYSYAPFTPAAVRSPVRAVSHDSADSAGCFGGAAAAIVKSSNGQYVVASSTAVVPKAATSSSSAAVSVVSDEDQQFQYDVADSQQSASSSTGITNNNTNNSNISKSDSHATCGQNGVSSKGGGHYPANAYTNSSSSTYSSSHGAERAFQVPLAQTALHNGGRQQQQQQQPFPAQHNPPQRQLQQMAQHRLAPHQPQQYHYQQPHTQQPADPHHAPIFAGSASTATSNSHAANSGVAAPTIAAMSAEQRERIERNRLMALEKLRLKREAEAATAAGHSNYNVAGTAVNGLQRNGSVGSSGASGHMGVGFQHQPSPPVSTASNGHYRVNLPPSAAVGGGPVQYSSGGVNGGYRGYGGGCAGATAIGAAPPLGHQPPYGQPQQQPHYPPAQQYGYVPYGQAAALPGPQPQPQLQPQQPYVFSTGKGSKVATTDEAQQRVAGLFTDAGH